jgi:hypothetical protein
MNNRTLYVTLAASAAVAFTFTLLLYYLVSRRNPVPRLHYGLFVSVLPAIGALVVQKFIKLLVSWRRVVLVYFLLCLMIFIQFFVRSYLPLERKTPIGIEAPESSSMVTNN